MRRSFSILLAVLLAASMLFGALAEDIGPLAAAIEQEVPEEEVFLGGDEPEAAGYADFVGEIAAPGDGVAIDEASFPDDTFREIVRTTLDADGDGALSAAECAAVETLDVHEQGGITSMKGVELFPNLKRLNCSGNALTSLDIAGNPLLTELNCGFNKLTSLNLSANALLETVKCEYNQLTGLDASGKAALRVLDCWYNQLTSVNVAGDAALESLDCDHNQLTGLDLSDNYALKNLACYGNSIAVIDFTDCRELHKPIVYSNPLPDGGEYVIWGGEDRAIFADAATRPLVRLPDANHAVVADNMTYTGKKLTTAVEVYLDDAMLTPDADYAVVGYKKNKGIGTASVVIEGKGKFSGTLTGYFDILPREAAGLKLKKGKKKVTVSWNKAAKVSGYEIEYSLSKDFTGSKTVKVKGASAKSKVISGLKSKKTYYFRIRTYAGKKPYYSEWSARKSVKVS